MLELLDMPRIDHDYASILEFYGPWPCVFWPRLSWTQAIGGIDLVPQMLLGS